ncbi:MAG: PqiC family protein [candidate division NC10 bacterium]
MMRRPLLKCVILSLTPLLVVLGGCASTPPTRFYVLNQLPSSKAEHQAAATEHGLAIGVGPVELPQYLHRPQIVTRGSGNKLHLSEFDRWAEPLERNVPRILAENLSVLLSTDRVAVFPWERSTPIDYQVAVKITRFGGRLGGESSLVARWSVMRVKGKKGKEVLMTRRSTFRELADGQDYEATTSAMSRTLADLSREIAAEIKAVSQKAPDR